MTIYYQDRGDGLSRLRNYKNKLKEIEWCDIKSPKQKAILRKSFRSKYDRSSLVCWLYKEIKQADKKNTKISKDKWAKVKNRQFIKKEIHPAKRHGAGSDFYPKFCFWYPVHWALGFTLPDSQ